MTNENAAEAYRLFIAVPIAESVKTEIEKAQDELRRAVPADCVRWTRREQYHLTLKFLGSVGVSNVETLAAMLRQACGSFRALDLKARRIGFFPNAHRPRVIWVGMQDARGQLPLLQSAVESLCEPFTQEKSLKEFSGHVTLGRIKIIKRPQAEALARAALTMADQIFGEWTAGEVELIRSRLSPDGSSYNTIAAAPLQGASS